MKTEFRKSAFVIVSILCITLPVYAHWLNGMDYKIHYPQEPDANGLAVCLNTELADDFMCTQTGAIGDIYFWISAKADANAVINQWTISIAADACGLPGNILWTWDKIGTVKIMSYGQGSQDWYCPNTPSLVPNDHTKFSQVHIGAIKNTFTQQQGQIYWLIIRAVVQDYPTKAVGWNTSTTNFFSGAMWKSPASGWQPLEEVDNPDLAFVIQSECYSGRPDYTSWVNAGKPECWCYLRQCHGDADGYLAGDPKQDYFYVGTSDLNCLISAWLIKDSPKGPGISREQECCNFDHLKAGDSKQGYWRVGTGDLSILTATWYVKQSPKGPGVPANCLPGNRIPPPKSPPPPIIYRPF